MTKLKKYIQIAGCTIVLMLGTMSKNSLEAKQDVGSRLWNVGTYKIPKVVKLSAEGAIACYAAYIAFGLAVDSMPDVQRLIDWKKPLTPIFERLIHNGCIIAGLGGLAYFSGNACINNLESL